MEPTHHAHEAEHGHGHDDYHNEDWHNPEFVEGWIERQKERAAERSQQFAIIRALIPRLPDAEFRYLNLGAGPGVLDDVLLSHFPNAQATVLDGSLPMLMKAQERLAKYEGRVEYIEADLRTEWHEAVTGPFDFIITTLTVHHLEEPWLIRDFYEDSFHLLGHGGMLLNMEYVRPARPSLLGLAEWAGRDPEAGLSGRTAHANLPGTLSEHLLWLNESGFPIVEVPWKNMNLALFVAFKDHPHLPETEHDHGEGGHTHG